MRKKTVECPSCITSQPRDQKFCANCGAELPEATDQPPAGHSEARRGKLIAIATLVVVLVAGVVAGGVLKLQHDRAAKRERAIALAEQQKIQAQQEIHDTCQATFSDLTDSLEEVQGKLQVGMNFSDYGGAVGGASVAYNKIDFEDVGNDCIRAVGIHTEAALNQYIKASTKWNECIQDYDCDTDDINLQSHWSRATKNLDKADTGLNELAP